jgi:hypothetical protein
MAHISLYDDVDCRYFKKPGPQNTGAIMEMVSKRADTALLLQPANSFRFFDLKVKEVIGKPAEF